jgi:hypothetical protein
MVPDFDRGDRIREFLGHPTLRGFGEPLIDLEEDAAARPRSFDPSNPPFCAKR